MKRTTTPKAAKRARIPGVAWTLLADQRARFAAELRWMVDRSYQSLRAGTEGRNGFDKKEPAGATDAVALARGKAEGCIEDEYVAAKTAAELIEAELWCLLDALERLATAHDRTAVLYATPARRGRPPTRNAWLALLLPKRRSNGGAPSATPFISDSTIMTTIEGRAEGRTELAALRDFATRTQRSLGRGVVPDAERFAKQLRGRLSRLREKARS